MLSFLEIGFLDTNKVLYASFFGNTLTEGVVLLNLRDAPCTVYPSLVILQRVRFVCYRIFMNPKIYRHVSSDLKLNGMREEKSEVGAVILNLIIADWES